MPVGAVSVKKEPIGFYWERHREELRIRSLIFRSNRSFFDKKERIALYKKSKKSGWLFFLSKNEQFARKPTERIPNPITLI